MCASVCALFPPQLVSVHLSHFYRHTHPTSSQQPPCVMCKQIAKRLDGGADLPRNDALWGRKRLKELYKELTSLEVEESSFRKH